MLDGSVSRLPISSFQNLAKTGCMLLSFIEKVERRHPLRALQRSTRDSELFCSERVSRIKPFTRIASARFYLKNSKIPFLKCTYLAGHCRERPSTGHQMADFAPKNQPQGLTS